MRDEKGVRGCGSLFEKSGIASFTSPHVFHSSPIKSITKETIMTNNAYKGREYRVLITSDVHHTEEKKWYGVHSDDRVQLWVDKIKEEHARRPIDLLLFAGDSSLDHYLLQGSYTSKGISNAKVFMDKYVSQLPPEIPYFIAAGNHEQYNDEQWKSITGNSRQGAVALEEDLFIILDAFGVTLEPNFHGELAVYSPVNVDFIKEKMAEYPNHRVWLVSHWFNVENESEEFKNLIKYESRIKGLFAGHIHKCSVIHLGEEYGNKTVAQTGQFSYSYFTPFPNDDPDAVKKSFWGFRELIIGCDEAYSNYIVAETDIATIGGERVSLERSVYDGISYQY